MNATRGLRRGFTMVEILIGVVIIALIASAVIPAAYRRIGDSYVNTLSNDLSTIGQAVNTYHDHVGMWPSTITQLITAPSPGALNICGNQMAAADTARWLGPYLSLTFPTGTTAVTVDQMTVSNTLTRSTSPSPTTIQITVASVDATTDATLEAQFDGTNVDNTTGIIRYSGTTLTYNLPITGC